MSDGRHGTAQALRLFMLVVATALLTAATPARSDSCTHGESSEAIAMVDGHFVTIQAAHATGCTP